MLYEYNTEYTTKHSATCYDEDLNSTGKAILTSRQCVRLRRLLHNPKVVSSSPAVGKKNFSFCKSRLRSLQLD